MSEPTISGALPPDPLQSLVAACLAEWEDTGPAALESLCARHPEHAAGLRQRIDALRGLGLLDAGEVPLPERIGRYRVVGVLGRGGMGIVFEAEQEQPRRRVAVKVLRGGLEDGAHRARFLHESLLLARLQHPGIAQIWEAGSAEIGGESLPFFAMELVDGAALTEWAARERLDVRARVALIAEVCDAVHHAHQKGVIHRDLKPSNVLVDANGRPKVLDFGVARAVDDERRATLHTRAGQIVGTLAYMSPEQAAGDPDAIDTRSDVYSLGVIAHELLAGALPYAVGGLRLVDALRVIQERPPVLLGTIDRKLAGDVETIVRTALEKDKEHRYASAAALAADLRAWLADEPIAARAPTAWYTLRKFARRNRVLVGGVAGVVLALALGLAGTLRGMLEARRAQADAERRWQQARTALDFQRRMLGAGQPFTEGRDARVADVIDRAARELEGAYPDQPEVEASLHLALGETYQVLSIDDAARAHTERAVALLRGALGDGAAETIAATARLAGMLVDFGELDLARAELARVASPTGRGSLDTLPDPGAGDAARRDALIDLRVTRAKLMRAEGRLADAAGEQRALLDEVRAIHGHDSERAIDLTNALATTLRLLGRSDEAIAMLRELHASVAARYGERNARTLYARLGLAIALQASGRIPESRELTEPLIDVAREVFGPEQSDTLTVLSTAGYNALVVGDAARAEALYREVVAIAERRIGPLSVLVVTGKNNLGAALGAQGKSAEAESLLRPLIAALAEARGADHPETLAAMHTLATTLKNSRRHADAGPLFEEVLTARRRTLGAEHPSTLRSMRNLALSYADAGRLDDADRLLREALDTARRALAADDFFTGDLLVVLGGNLVKLGRLAEAEPLMLEGHAWLARTLGADKAPVRDAAGSIASLYRQLERPDDAMAWEQRAKKP